MKRIFDIVFASIMMVCLFPLMLFVIFVLFFTGNGIWYIEKRIGLNEVSFYCYKFKTMLPYKEGIEEYQRIKWWGRILRNTSIDELPQLLNIIKGDMSVIGPRPLPVRYLDRMTDDVKKRHLIKPGLTGWAQVNGRNILSWDEKFELDLYYLAQRNTVLDCIILLKTVYKVFFLREINQNNQQSMPEFEK